MRTLSGHTEAVTSAAFNADGSLIVTSSTDRTARLWSCETGLEVTRLDGHVAPARSRNSRLLAPPLAPKGRLSW
jgi:WD40 repeat protein